MNHDSKSAIIGSEHMAKRLQPALLVLLCTWPASGSSHLAVAPIHLPVNISTVAAGPGQMEVAAPLNVAPLYPFDHLTAPRGHRQPVQQHRPNQINTPNRYQQKRERSTDLDIITSASVSPFGMKLYSYSAYLCYFKSMLTS